MKIGPHAPDQETRAPRSPAAWVACLLLGALGPACATVKSGDYAKPLDAQGQVIATSKTAAGLLISAQEVQDLASPYFGLIEVTFENPTPDWIHIDRTSVKFTAEATPHTEIPDATEIAGWERAIRQRNAIRSVNTSAALALVAVGGAVVAAASPGRTAGAVGGLAAVGAGSALVGRELAERARDADAVARFPDTHLLSVPVAIPPGLFVKKWMLLRTKSDVLTRCIDRMTLSIQRGSAAWEHFALMFKVPGSGWQPKGCALRGVR